MTYDPKFKPILPSPPPSPTPAPPLRKDPPTIKETVAAKAVLRQMLLAMR